MPVLTERGQLSMLFHLQPDWFSVQFEEGNVILLAQVVKPCWEDVQYFLCICKRILGHEYYSWCFLEVFKQVLLHVYFDKQKFANLLCITTLATFLSTWGLQKNYNINDHIQESLWITVRALKILWKVQYSVHHCQQDYHNYLGSPVWALLSSPSLIEREVLFSSWNSDFDCTGTSQNTVRVLKC